MVCRDELILSNGLSVTQNLTLPAVNYQQQFSVANINPAYQALQGSISLDLGTSPTAAFTASVWLASGPGPVYTPQLQVVSVAGLVTPATRFCGQWGRSQMLPNVNRPFDPALDRVEFRHNNGYTAPTSGLGQMTFSLDPLSQDVSDCCAETLAKLDEVLAAVTKLFPRLT